MNCVHSCIFLIFQDNMYLKYLKLLYKIIIYIVTFKLELVDGYEIPDFEDFFS